MGLYVLLCAWKLLTTEEQKFFVILLVIGSLPQNSGKFVLKDTEYSRTWAGAMCVLSAALCITNQPVTRMLWFVLWCNSFPPFPSSVLQTTHLLKWVDCRQYFNFWYVKYSWCFLYNYEVLINPHTDSLQWRVCIFLYLHVKFQKCRWVWIMIKRMKSSDWLISGFPLFGKILQNPWEELS